jgi:hypothetical protein
MWVTAAMLFAAVHAPLLHQADIKTALPNGRFWQ